MKNLIQVGEHTINVNNVARFTEYPRGDKEVIICVYFTSNGYLELTGIEALEFSNWLDKNSIKIKE